MSKTVKRICLSLALFITLVFVVFVFNQTVQVVHSAREISPVLAKVVEWTLVLFYCILLLTPLVLWLRIPKRIQPPLLAEGIEYERFMETFKKRLSRNPRLRNVPLDLHADVGAALQVLDKHADEAVSSAASAVFLSTAVLQSGRLDVLVVLAAQTRLIWRVAHVYYQRPSSESFCSCMQMSPRQRSSLRVWRMWTSMFLSVLFLARRWLPFRECISLQAPS